MFYSKNIFMKTLAVFSLLVIIMFNCVWLVVAALEAPAESSVIPAQTLRAELEEAVQAVILKDSPILFPETKYNISYSLESCNNALETVVDNIKKLDKAIASGNYTPSACEQMSEEKARLETVMSNINTSIAKITSWEEDYYYATKAWQFFIEQGYSETVASAIIGNMMIETSGGTLSLNPTIYNSTRKYYGLCQWSLRYYPEVDKMSFEDQLEYLNSSIEKEFKIFGKCYAKGFTYEDFIAMEDPAEAALAFAKVYERCGAGSYKLRMQAAIEAYKYFDLKAPLV